jgi:hypothetical protein
MATKSQILTNRIVLYAIHNTKNAIRHTLYENRVLSARGGIQNRATIYAKQSQFAGHSNERNLFFNKVL